MASVRQTRTGKFELTVRSALLPKGRVFFTFDDEQAAKDYGAQCDKWLKAGMVPPELLEPAREPAAQTLGPLIRTFINAGQLSAADQGELERMLLGDAGKTKITEFNYDWCERWVQKMKLVANLAPGTIRKRVQALRRAIDWHLRKTPDLMVGNPLALLPRGYSAYTAKDAEDARALGNEPKVDVERDRRLAAAEEGRVRQALAGARRSELAGVELEDRERTLVVDEDFALLFEIILGTGMRLREAYRLRVGQVDLKGRKLRPQASKTWHGRVKYREIPMQPRVHAALASKLLRMPGAKADDLVFPFWDGEAGSLDKISTRLSARFSTLFDYAGVDGFVEHDLRHEATCRWYEMRRVDGQWMYREAEINKIMGWAPGSKMALRYASFRAEDLASRMWEGEAAAA